MKLRVWPEAELDVLEASIWYDETHLGLGDVFIDLVEDAYIRIEDGPLHYQRIHGDVRMVQTKRFGYGVYYILAEQQAVVIAVMHLHREPSAWRRRFEDAENRKIQE